MDEAVQLPDPEAILAHEGYVCALARHLVADPNQADDIVQQTWVAALEHAPRKATSLRAWLAAIERNLARKLARGESRRLARERRTARAEAVPSADEILALEESRRRLVHAVFELEEPYRSAIVLRYFENLPPRAIAKRLAVPVATVRTRVRRGLERLRLRFDREHGGNRAAWCLAIAPLAKAPPSTPGPGLAGRAEALISAALSISTGAKVAAVAALVVGLTFAGWELSRPARRLDDARLALGEERAPRATAADSGGGASEGSDAGAAGSAPARVPLSTPEPYGSLLVRVAWGDDGTPAANFGARVYAWSEPDPYFRNVEPWATTGADGTFRIDRIRAGKVKVALERGDGSYAGNTTVAPGEQAELSLTVPPGYEATGEVVDAGGRPVPGAEVWLSSLTGPHNGGVVERTGADGRFRVRSVTGWHWIGARAPGHAPSPLQSLRGSAGGAVNLRLTLPGPGGAVSGRVFDSAARPIADAAIQIGVTDLRTLRLSDGTVGHRAPPVRVRSDAEGRFHAAGLPPGSLPVVVRSHPHAIWKASVVVAPNETAQLDAFLADGVTLEGTVLDARGRPASGVDVWVGPPFEFAGSYGKSGADGSFRLEGLGIGEWTAVADAKTLGKASASFAPRPGQRLRWDAKLPAGATIAGRIVDENGAPLDGWWVSAQPLFGTAREEFYRARGLTNAEGRFALRNCRPTPHLLEAGVRKCEAFPAVTLDDARPGPDELVITIPAWARPSARMKGTAVGADGTPLGSVTIKPWNPDFFDVPIVTTEERTGRFEVGPVPPGTWALRVQAPGLPEVRTKARSLVAGETVDLGPVEVGGKGGSLVVSVASGAGALGGPPSLTLPTLEDPLPFDGTAARSGLLAPGSYLLQVGGRGIAAAVVSFDIHPGEETRLAVTPREGVDRRIRFPIPAGERPSRSARVVIRDESRTVVFDRSVRRVPGRPLELELGLAPGDYSVEATAHPGRRAEGRFRVGGSGSEELEFTMR